MEQNIQSFEMVRLLTDRLNQYRHEYYNLSAPSVSDQEYDRLFDQLAALEKQTGIVMGNSPTQTVGYPSVSELEKTVHTIPLLSLDKPEYGVHRGTLSLLLCRHASGGYLALVRYAPLQGCCVSAE